MSSDPKTIADLPPSGKKPEDSKASSSLPPKEADAVKGGALPKEPGQAGPNHNQTLRARHASRP